MQPSSVTPPSLSESLRVSRPPALLACLLAIALVGIVASPSAAHAAVSFSSNDSNGRIEYGTDAVFTGSLPSGESGRTVVLQHKRIGGSWQQVDAATTDGTGAYRLAYGPRHNGNFRAIAKAASATESDQTSDTVAIDVRANLAGNGPDHTLSRRTHTVTGVLRPGRSGRSVTLEKYYSGSGWKEVASGETASDGSFRLPWTPVELGRFSLRVRFNGDTYNLSDRAGIPGGVNVYRSTVASWYGPGLYGNRTACGQTLRSDTQGVAHKTLPCGTRVRFYYRGRTKVVPVIDRGPYIDGRTWDLTYATKQALGFPDGVDTVWSTR